MLVYELDITLSSNYSFLTLKFLKPVLPAFFIVLSYFLL